MKRTLSGLASLLLLVGGTLGSSGCTPSSALTDAAVGRENPDAAGIKQDGGSGLPDLSSGSIDLARGSGDFGSDPAPNPPPASCNQRSPGVTAIQVLVQVDEYQGLITGRNGTHEIVYGTIVSTPWVYAVKIVDTTNVQLALNVKSAKDPTGLPMEVPLSVGQVVEVEGEYIPKSTASASDAKGPAAVIHYSHDPCGYITIAGTIYK